MVYKTNSYVLPLISVFLVLLALAGEANAGRNVPKNPSKDEKKEPEWLIGHDGSFLIPGIGRVMVPPLHTVSPYAPFPGTGSPSTGSGSHNYVPGGDDTFVPNPGYEVPTPGRTAPANATP